MKDEDKCVHKLKCTKRLRVVVSLNNNKMQSSIVFRILLLRFAVHPLVQGKPQIVAPYPDNLYVIEYEKAAVSCSVQETDSSKKTDRVSFYEKSSFGELKLIPDEGPNGHTFYKNDRQGSKLTTTLHFNNVTRSDGHKRYECYGFTGSEKVKYGFTVVVIGLDELPRIKDFSEKKVRFGDEVVLNCNLTNIHFQTTLSKLLWKKDGKVIEEVLHPRHNLKLQAFKVTRPQDGGIYSCHLITKLMSFKTYNISGNISVTVEPKFFTSYLEDNDIRVIKGDEAKLVCSAKGNPLTVAWRRNLTTTYTMETFNLSAKSEEYQFYNVGELENQTLVIRKADLSHVGQYYCCIRSGCQVFSLAVIVELKIIEGNTKIKGVVSGHVTMECPADGVPLHVTWRRLNKEGQEIGLNSNRSAVSRSCSTCRSKLTISNLEKSDQGRYVCRASVLGSTGQHHFDLDFSSSVESSATVYGLQYFYIPLTGLVALLIALSL